MALLTADLPQTDRTLTGPGDDCAILKGTGEPQHAAEDGLPGGEHSFYQRCGCSPRVGWKALCRVISDMAAMGGSPQEMLVTVALPGGTPVRWVQRLYERAWPGPHDAMEPASRAGRPLPCRTGPPS